MYETLTARIDESYVWLGTDERVERIRHTMFRAVPEDQCDHRDGTTICAGCASSWQNDYTFDDPFPFARVQGATIAELIEAGRLEVGTELVMPEAGITTVVTGTGGLMLPDGRVFANPSAAANAVLDGSR